MRQSGKKPDGRVALTALVLWGQLVFGLGMTLWRDSLILFSDWKPYPSFVPREFDRFIELAIQSSPANSTLVYLSPTGDVYTARFARLSYFLYPREVLWLGAGPRTTVISRWAEVDLADANWVRLIKDQKVNFVLIDDIPSPLPLSGERIPFDSARYVIELPN